MLIPASYDSCVNVQISAANIKIFIFSVHTNPIASILIRRMYHFTEKHIQFKFSQRLITVSLPDLGIHCEHRQLDQPHLTVSPVKDIYRYNEAVSLQCHEGYILRVPSSARCTEDSVFDIPSTSVCEGIVVSIIPTLSKKKT